MKLGKSAAAEKGGSAGTGMDAINEVVKRLCAFLWDFPMPVLLLGMHLYFTVRLRGIQRRIPEGIRQSFTASAARGNGSESTFGVSGKKEALSPYAALATALAATIGTGNIIGISTAIAIGGPGALFWCIASGLLGMATSYAECFLSAKYKVRLQDGQMTGGPMYVMEHVLHQKGLAILFSLFAIAAALSVGSSVQAHSLTAAITSQVRLSPHLVGIGAGMLAGSILVGGAKKIARVCTYLVPVMSVIYLSGCLYVIGKNIIFLPAACRAVLGAAFSSRAWIGGVAGYSVMAGIRVGMAKGLFTNEAGMGSMPMTAAVTEGVTPQVQGIISMTGIFWDTLVMCTITGLTILCDMVRSPRSYVGAGRDTYCFVAFQTLPFAGEKLLSGCLVLFAFATIIGWSFYGECAVQYLWGRRSVPVFQIIYMVFVYLGAVFSLELVWNLSDFANACMAIPNLLCLWQLRKEVIQETK